MKTSPNPRGKTEYLLLLMLSLLLGFAGCTTTPAPPEITPTFPLPTLTEPPDELSIYLDTAIDLIQYNSVYSVNLDWEKIRSEAHQQAEEVDSTTALYPIIRRILNQTGDKHGYLVPPPIVSSNGQERPSKDLPQIKSEIIEGKIGVVVIPTFESTDQGAVTAFALQIQQTIQVLDEAQVCSWVVDLRGNEGGNGFAMLLGLGPLLPDEILGFHTHPSGEQQAWLVKDGQVYLGDHFLAELPQPPYQLSNPAPPIAIITNEVTTSAGELVAIAFNSWPNTNSIGQRTLGRTTAPTGFILSDGAMLGISTHWFTDHTGQIYSGKYRPQQLLSSRENPILRNPGVPEEAIQWLLSQPPCQE
jgi:hypothetical protein